MQDRNLRSVHPAAPRHRLTRRLVIPNIIEPFKVIAVQLGNSISRLRPITKGTSIRFTRNAGIQRQRRSTRYTLVISYAYNLTVHLTDCAAREQRKSILHYGTENQTCRYFKLSYFFDTKVQFTLISLSCYKKFEYERE